MSDDKSIYDLKKDSPLDILRDLEPDPGVDVHDQIELIVDLWDFYHGTMQYEAKVDGSYVVEFSTGGWSENEEVIEALMDSLWWQMFWWKSVRGGHYWLRVRNIR